MRLHPKWHTTIPCWYQIIIDRVNIVVFGLRNLRLLHIYVTFLVTKMGTLSIRMNKLLGRNISMAAKMRHNLIPFVQRV